MRISVISGTIVLFCVLNVLAVSGIAVGVRSTYAHSSGQARGNIRAHIIENSIVTGVKTIYTGNSARCVNICPAAVLPGSNAENTSATVQETGGNKERKAVRIGNGMMQIGNIHVRKSDIFIISVEKPRRKSQGNPT